MHAHRRLFRESPATRRGSSPNRFGRAALTEPQNRQLLGQLEAARRFQRSMIPGESLRVPGLALAFANQPAQQVGGDLLDVLPLPGRRALVFVGDAMGHGVEAAMIMAAARTSFLVAVRSTSDPAELLREVNEGLHPLLLGERFLTAACARLDPANGRAEIALAGHPSPLHVRPPTGEVKRPGQAGLPLGVVPGETYQSRTCPFLPGDTLVFFADGIVEAVDGEGQFYGEERFLDLVRSHAGCDPDGLLRILEADLQKHCRTLGQQDDVTALFVRALADGGA